MRTLETRWGVMGGGPRTRTPPSKQQIRGNKGPEGHGDLGTLQWGAEMGWEMLVGWEEMGGGGGTGDR